MSPSHSCHIPLLRLLLPLIFFLLSPVPCSTSDPSMFWNDYPTCECNCHTSVWNSQSCTLQNTCGCSARCLCETTYWLLEVSKCISQSCSASAMSNTASIVNVSCASNGYPLTISTEAIIDAGLAAMNPTSGKSNQLTFNMSIHGSL